MSLTRSRAVLELGKRLVAQLDADDDLLSSWMAHDIAQRIEAAEKAPTEAQAAAHDACAKAILELWRHRDAFPRCAGPLEELEPVVRTLASLDVDRTKYRYFPEALREAATADTDEITKRWLDLAIGLDYTARLLIQFALRSAAHRAASRAESWIELAQQAGADEGAERGVVRFVLGDDEGGKANEDQNADLRDKLSRLESLAELATALATDLRTRLDAVDAPRS